MHLSVQVKDGEVHLRYEDDGAGMSEEHLGRLFDPFFTTRRGQGGSGLGAHPVYNRVKSLSGDIRVSSQPGCGLVYEIRFPQYTKLTG